MAVVRPSGMAVIHIRSSALVLPSTASHAMTQAAPPKITAQATARLIKRIACTLCGHRERPGIHSMKRSRLPNTSPIHRQTKPPNPKGGLCSSLRPANREKIISPTDKTSTSAVETVIKAPAPPQKMLVIRLASRSSDGLNWKVIQRSRARVATRKNIVGRVITMSRAKMSKGPGPPNRFCYEARADRTLRASGELHSSAVQFLC